MTNGWRRERAQDESACPERTDALEERRGGDQTDADAEHDHDQVAFRVVAVLECAVPSVDHLQDWRADANGEQQCRKEWAHTHEANDSTAKPTDWRLDRSEIRGYDRWAF